MFLVLILKITTGQDIFNVSIYHLVDLQLAEEENLNSIKKDQKLQLKFIWSKLPLIHFRYVFEKYPEISKKVLTILLPFSTTYLWEHGFSALKT